MRQYKRRKEQGVLKARNETKTRLKKRRRIYKLLKLSKTKKDAPGKIKIKTILNRF
jgi:hypothetical protein